MVMAIKYQEICGKPLAKAIKDKAKTWVSFSNGLLVTKHDVALRLFNPVISNIVAHVEKLSKEPEMKDLQYFMLHKAIKD